ncbi:MAG TPA: TatD family hydrolase [Gammaproteobacteria bacterium]|nr:TatD family hydrolase [Gammaproteobacteria bacterium]
MLVDSHCHLDRLDLKPFDGELDGALMFARDNGVGFMLCVCINLETFPRVLELARRYPDIATTVGVHPNDHPGQAVDPETLRRHAAEPEVVAIGETGLDYFRSEGDLDWQRERFREHIRVARETGKPLVVHSRDAREDTLPILEEEGAGEAGGVMHCFVDDWQTAQRALDLGFYISFSGIVTFKNAAELHEVARQVPADRMLVETDSPYLAPVPYRGKPNQPAYVRHVAEGLAELRGTTVEAIAETTTENFFRLFQGARPAAA